ncbi:MAG TPA: efflux transporter outer membrane subunit [Acidobacteriaceae bacterium]|nr:efflux transporter outer membrane subunit [Acidobacteriaceae bacterium]
MKRASMLSNKRIAQGLSGAAALAMACGLGGCRVGPRYHAPAPPQVTATNYKESTVNFQDQPGWKVANPSDAMLRGKWWEVFQEPELNSLEDQLSVNNQTLKQYYNQYLAARAIVQEARSQFWPTITTGPGWSRQKTSGTLTSSTIANTGRTSTIWSFPVDATWAPDFWGKIRNEVRTEEYAAQASAADLASETLLEQSALAQYYFEIRGQDMLQQILNQTVAADQKALEANQGAYEAGTGNYISVVESRATLASAQSAQINVGLLRAQYQHAIATLLGKPATDFTIPVRPMIYNPPAIPTGVPSQLLERRPDIAAAERIVAEGNATIGIGYGAFFPQINLSAAGGLQSSALSNLVQWPSRFWSIGASAAQVIFDAGLFRADLHQYEAQYNANVAAYRQTTLTAFQQVEDSLSATRIYSQQILQQQEAVKSAQEFLDLEMQRYNLGVDPYFNVVTAQTTLLNNQQTLNALQVSQMISTVQLVQALGGGWDISQLPTAAQAGQKIGSSEYKMQR